MNSRRSLHIGLISRYYPPDPGGGLCLYTRQMAREFTRQGHRVTVFAANADPRFIQEEDGEVRIRRIPQLKVFDRSLTGATCLLNSKRIAAHIRDVHEAQPLDIVQAPATFFESLVFGQRMKPEFKIPLVVKFHENRETYERIEGNLRPMKQLRRNWLKGLIRKASMDADHLLGVSQHSLTGMLEYLECTDTTIPCSVSASPVDLQLFKPTLAPPVYFQSFGLPDRSPFLFYSGRLIHEKGLHLLVEAFLSDLSERFPDLRLAIAGEFDYRQPDYENRVRKLMAGHPAADRIHFLGRIPYECMPYWYSHSELFVGPSFCEPFGRVFIEAMACETPLVSFQSGGPREFIHQGINGCLVNKQTPESLAQALAILLQSPELRRRIGLEARQSVARQYSKEQIATELVGVYRQVLLQQSRSSISDLQTRPALHSTRQRAHHPVSP